MRLRMRSAVALALAGGLSLFPSAAGAKVAKEMTLVAPGLATPLRLANTTPAEIPPNLIVRKAGLLGSTADRRLAGRPPGRLGPRYVATYQWLVDADRTTPIRQEVYPFAAGGAVTRITRAQRVLDVTLVRGWYLAGPELTLLLVAAGVPVPESSRG